jgi:xanthine/CO dehydrogenase XdhC/CoxF family maturation factor
MNSDVLDEVTDLKVAGEPSAIATVVRTVAITAAKASAKALIRSDGTISAGWIGGGCAPAAVLKSARDAAQGRSDEQALAAAFAAPARHVGFVGSHREASALRASLTATSVDQDRVAQLCSPAGLNIGAVTPEEIVFLSWQKSLSCADEGNVPLPRVKE